MKYHFVAPLVTLVVILGFLGVAKTGILPTASAHTSPNIAMRYNGAAFVSDVTIPDYQSLKACSWQPKTWKVLNDGTTTWNGNYSLVRTNGSGNEPDLRKATAPYTKVTVQAKPNTAVNVTVRLHVLCTPGQYSSTYELSASSVAKDWKRGHGTSVSKITRFGDPLTWTIINHP